MADNSYSVAQPEITRPTPWPFIGRLADTGPLVRLRQSLARPTDALPLDIFRVLAGLLAFISFLQTSLEAGDFSGPDGLIDHELSQKIFWFTRIGLFQSGLGIIL